MQAQRTLRQLLATNIKALRQSLGISQEELADLCGLHRTYISDIERCNRNISIDNIARIANALHTSASELLKENGTDESC